MGVTTMRVFLLVTVFACVVSFAASENTPIADSDSSAFTGDPEKDGAAEMAMIDLNKDGKATLEEIKSFMRKSYYDEDFIKKVQDTKETKGLSAPEKEKRITSLVEKDATELLQFMDTDKNGHVDLQEAVNSFKEDEKDMHPDESEFDDDADIDDMYEDAA